MKKTITILITLGIMISGIAYSSNAAKTNTSPPSHQLWDELVSKHASKDGTVDYKGFMADIDKFNKYLSLLSAHHPDEGWTKYEIMTYWINAYNAFTVKLILDHYPVKSIKDIGGAVGSPWKIEFIEIEGKKYHLDNIEHDILRKNYFDPRIHFVVNCASFSCPKLLDDAFKASKLGQQMEKATINFINNPEKNKIKPNKVKISKLFKWYKGDFTKNGTIIDFLNKYSNTKVSKDAKIDYMEYDWSLNN